MHIAAALCPSHSSFVFHVSSISFSSQVSCFVLRCHAYACKCQIFAKCSVESHISWLSALSGDWRPVTRSVLAVYRLPGHAILVPVLPQMIWDLRIAFMSSRTQFWAMLLRSTSWFRASLTHRKQNIKYYRALTLALKIYFWPLFSYHLGLSREHQSESKSTILDLTVMRFSLNCGLRAREICKIPD